MHNELKNIIETYNNKGKIADNLFVRKIISLIRENKNLYDYITTINHFEGDYKTYNFLQYFFENKQIDIDLPNMIDLIEIKHEELIKTLNNKDKITFINLNVLYHLLHEMEHVCQVKNYNELNPLYIENKLYHISDCFSEKKVNYNKGIEKKYQKYYYKYKQLYYDGYYFHDITPIERMANIKAIKEVLALSNMLNTNEIVKDYFKFSLLFMECSHYIDNNECSLKTYLDMKQYIADKCGLYIRDKSDRELLDIDDLSDEYKFLYGLPVYEDVISKKEQQMKETKSYKLLYKPVTK